MRLSQLSSGDSRFCTEWLVLHNYRLKGRKTVQSGLFDTIIDGKGLLLCRTVGFTHFLTGVAEDCAILGTMHIYPLGWLTIV